MLAFCFPVLSIIPFTFPSILTALVFSGVSVAALSVLAEFPHLSLRFGASKDVLFIEGLFVEPVVAATYYSVMSLGGSHLRFFLWQCKGRKR